MPFTPITLLHPGNFSEFSVGSYLGCGETPEEKQASETAAIRFFQHYGVLPSRNTNFICKSTPNCGRMTTQRDPARNILGFRLFCPICRIRVSPLRNTFMARAKLTQATGFSVSALLKIMTSWFLGKSAADCSTETGITLKTCLDWYSFCREVSRVTEGHDRTPIGGANDVVEIDESHLFHRKYNRGRVLRAEHIWIVGGISRLTKRRFAVRVRRRTAIRLTSVIRTAVAANTYVITDSWRGYSQLAQNLPIKGHRMVNHSRNFVDPAPLVVQGLDPQLGVPTQNGGITIQVHTNTIERMWRDLKENVINVRGDDAHLDNYIGSYLYNTNIIRQLPNDKGTRFLRFLTDVSRVYPGPFVDAIADLSAGEACNCVECDV